MRRGMNLWKGKPVLKANQAEGYAVQNLGSVATALWFYENYNVPSPASGDSTAKWGSIWNE